MSNSRPQAYQRLAELLIGSRISMALRVVAEHQIADLLAAGPQTAEALSSATGIPAGTLRRLMRGLTAIGVFEEASEGRFANTDVSAYMRTDATSSLREMILVLNDDALLQGWQRLPTVLQSGAPAFAEANGMSFFQYIAADPTRSATMGKFMAGIYGPEGPKIAAGYPFGRFNTLIDIGGGQGHIVAEVLQHHPALKGALLDLPPTAEVARNFLAGRGLSHRCDVFAGDFFQSVPAGYDAYMIKSVLHDWDDGKAVQILHQCRDAMPSHGRVLVIEIVVSPGQPMGHPHPMIDLEMMVTFGGKERTEQEFATLLRSAGLTLEQVTPINGSFFSVVEATPA
jgi:O-methyltransferase domain